MLRLFGLCWIMAPALVAAWPGFVSAAEDQPGVTTELRGRAVSVLRGVLKEEQGRAKVRAAEFLIALDYPGGVKEALVEQFEAAEQRPGDRIGIWRVRARLATGDRERKPWTDNICGVFLDAGAADRLGAAEALAELGYTIPEKAIEPLKRAALSGDDPMAAYAAWALANSSHEEGEKRLAELLGSDLPETRNIAARALGRLPEISGAAWNELVLRSATTGGKAEQYQVCLVLAQIGVDEDVPLLIRLLEAPEAEVRSAAAYAILRIGRRVPHRLTWLDGAVIALYGAGMIGVGWYYSRRTVTTEDYLLGGRKMKPFGVGLSLFATLLSTISYLAWPGEMIRYGPVMFSAIAVYPLIYLVVGWCLIPFIMKLRITSAYELLETRLGLSVRLLGSMCFLSMRLLWMAVIIYATTSKALVPMLGLDPSVTPWLCAVLGLVTVIYTSMGGLRAVVLTDVVQTLILFAAAVATIVLVTGAMGNVASWWPDRWPVHWPETTVGYDPAARASVFGVMLAVFTWYVCTSGSDQMAIQRYLATRDVKAARRVMAVSLIADATVAIFLGLLGLALLAYFRANPHFIPDSTVTGGQGLIREADKLFPRFIVFGLPMGISGLVVAGLLAAAMSSLSSGVNSSCSVITVDFVDRFRARRNGGTETDHVRLAKYISVLVGIVVVVLSVFVGMVKGNLIEIAYKVVNLLTVPLFGLFFMAMFVRWATAPGTILGAICGLAVIAAINYWEEMTGTKGISFVWAMPLGFLTQIAVGSIVSLVPIGRRGPPTDLLTTEAE